MSNNNETDKGGDRQRQEQGPSSIWVFGYGSLCWNPGFKYARQVFGSVPGFARRFWQGNVTHRGVPGKPARVVTLIRDPEESTYGVAFQLPDEDALEYLNTREVTLGGYETHQVLFHPRDLAVEPFWVTVYVAVSSNEHWLGPASCYDIAKQVTTTSGKSGHNVEYVLRLAEWMRRVHPDIQDDHLLSLEVYIHLIVRTDGDLRLKALLENNRTNASCNQPRLSWLLEDRFVNNLIQGTNVQVAPQLDHVQLLISMFFQPKMLPSQICDATISAANSTTACST